MCGRRFDPLQRVRPGVDEFTTIAERWLYYSDGRDLYPYCPSCAKREFADNAPTSERAQRREATE